MFNYNLNTCYRLRVTERIFYVHVGCFTGMSRDAYYRSQISCPPSFNLLMHQLRPCLLIRVSFYKSVRASISSFINSIASSLSSCFTISSDAPLLFALPNSNLSATFPVACLLYSIHEACFFLHFIFLQLRTILVQRF